MTVPQHQPFSISWNHISHGNDTILFYYFAFSGTFTSNNVYIVTHIACTHARTHASQRTCVFFLRWQKSVPHASNFISQPFSLSLTRSLSIFDFPPIIRCPIFPLVILITWWLQLRFEIFVCTWMHSLINLVAVAELVVPPWNILAN